MPFTLNVALFDLAAYYSAGFPALAGSIFAPPPPSRSAATPLDPAATTAAAPLSLSFPSPAVPPTGASALLVTEPATGGDIVRSGVVTALPATAATVITIPPVSISAATIVATLAGTALPT